MLRKGFANDHGPSARKPRHRCFGPIHPAQRLAQELADFLHEGRDSNTADARISWEMCTYGLLLRQADATDEGGVAWVGMQIIPPEV